MGVLDLDVVPGPGRSEGVLELGVVSGLGWRGKGRPRHGCSLWSRMEGEGTVLDLSMVLGLGQKGDSPGHGRGLESKRRRKGDPKPGHGSGSRPKGRVDPRLDYSPRSKRRWGGPGPGRDLRSWT